MSDLEQRNEFDEEQKEDEQNLSFTVSNEKIAALNSIGFQVAFGVVATDQAVVPQLLFVRRLFRWRLIRFDRQSGETIDEGNRFRLHER